ncbi:MAG: amidoligase family protein [Clostridium sp.]|jgi:hypothetical protein|nr:amidoligase family protein [Clostridium sp.]
MLKQQNYGVEIEMPGITREAAAKALAAHFGTEARYAGGFYGAWEVTDPEGKTWKLMSDASIYAERKIGKKQYTPAHDKSYSVELVSPILTYPELPKLQEVVRQVRHAGAKVNTSCGIHVHVDAANHNAKTLRNLLGIMYGKEDLLFKALQVDGRRVNYCKKTREDILTAARKDKNLDMNRLGAIWYGTKNWQPCSSTHYDNSRYHALNLHATFSKKTVEFRLFNSTLHAGEVKAYVHLALAVSAQAIRQKSTQLTKTASDNEKFTFRTWLLRLGMIGEEFANTRDHLMKHLDGDAAWRYTPEHYPTHPANVAAETAALV